MNNLELKKLNENDLSIISGGKSFSDGVRKGFSKHMGKNLSRLLTLTVIAVPCITSAYIYRDELKAILNELMSKLNK